MVALALWAAMGAVHAQAPHPTPAEAAALADSGDYAKAWELAAPVRTAPMQLIAARAASDQVVYYLAPAGAPMSDQRAWLDRAMEAAKTAVELDQGSAPALVQLARAKGEIARRTGLLQNLGTAPELKELFDKALTLDPNDADALVGLAMWHLELVQNGVGWLYGGRRDAVLPLLERGVAAAPKQLNLRVEYATALIALEKPAEAREQLVIALELPGARASDEIERQRARSMLESLGGGG